MKIVNWEQLSKIEQRDILARPMLFDKQNIKEKTQEILQKVKSGGDQSLLELTAQYDLVQLNTVQVTDDEFEEAIQHINAETIHALKFAKSQIEINQKSQLPRAQIITPCEGVTCERQPRAIERIGLYIPGGTAPLISTVLMLAIPAFIAGCEQRILCSPANSDGKINSAILYAAKLCGIQKVFKLGGAQAIAAMAYGTESIPKIDKIFGPGNAWVTQAKILVAQDPLGASIDMPAGPSEVMVIADEQADPEFIAADLLSQAEHGVDSQVILVTCSPQIALAVERVLNTQLEKLTRVDIAKQALTHSRIIIVDNIMQAINISNSYAPEHLILQIENPEIYVTQIKNAGAVFIGRWTPETVGDYVTGSNHVLPTYGFAKSYSGLSVSDFMKFINFQKVTRKGLEKIGPYAEKLAQIEGLQAHKQAVSLRLAEMVINDE